MRKQARVAERKKMTNSRNGGSKLTASKQKNSGNKNIKQEVLLQIPGCIVHLMDKREVLELAEGPFMLAQILDKGIPIATVIKVGDDICWPLTRDEPVAKLDSLHYLFSLPMKDSATLTYGVTFLEQYSSSLPLLDSFLKEYSCFSSTTSTKSKDLEWYQFASRIEDYNNVLARAIAVGTGEIVKGIFMCSNVYINQIQNGVDMISNRSTEEKNPGSVRRSGSSRKSAESTNESGINESLKRARNLSKMTENLSKSVLDGVGVATGSVTAPLITSQAGKAFLAMAPGEVLLASLVAINTILDAAEIAAKQALSTTSTATTQMVTNQFGENAGEAAKDVLATAGHCAGTAWNISKIRKAINPASSVSSGIARNARK